MDTPSYRQYTQGRLIGRGAQAQVYEYRFDHDPGTVYAVKVFVRGDLGSSDQAVSKEVHVTSNASHVSLNSRHYFSDSYADLT